MNVYVLMIEDNHPERDTDDAIVDVYATLNAAKQAAEAYAAELNAEPLDWKGGTLGWPWWAELIYDAEGHVSIQEYEVKS